jgi:biotin/methionine sulfoxide reductase
MTVEEGRLTSVAPFEHDTHPNKLISAMPEMVYSPLRVKTPVARRGWLDGDGGAGRGSDSFVEIGWDEALDRTAHELDRVRKQHGNQAIFGGSYGWSSAGRFHHSRTLLHRFLNTIGGFTGQVTNYSYGAAMAFLPRIVGQSESIAAPATSLGLVAEHADMLVAFGGMPFKNWEVQSGGAGTHPYWDHLAAMRAKGVRIVNVSPYRGDLPVEFESEWIPIRPNTDTALLLAMIGLLIDWDACDQAFLEEYTVGFDKLRDYVMGGTDGIAKTPAWAASITGLDPALIETLTRSMVGRNVMLTATWSLQRARNGEQPFWAIVSLAAALGQIGKAGCGFTFGYGSMNGIGNVGYKTPLHGPSIGRNEVDIFIPVARVADLLLQPGETIRFNGKDVTYPDIRLVYWAGGNPFHHHQDLNRLRDAFRKPETVIVNEQYWTATARHADIVLPATTTVERNDIGGSSRDPFLLAMHKAIEPVGQARNDFDIFSGLASRLGSEEQFGEGRNEEQWLRHMWDLSRESLKSRNIAAPDFDRFFSDGFFQMPEPDRPVARFEKFRLDPIVHPLETPSGRIELYCEAVAQADPQQPGHAHWKDPEEWLGGIVAQNYPIHLLTPQPEKRLHSQMEQSSISRSGKRDDRELLLMNPDDAKSRGIVDGDIVRLFNSRGACLASAAPREGVVKGVALLPTGATFDPDGAGLDRNSNPNVLTRDIGTSEIGQGCSAQTCLIEIEKFVGDLPVIEANAPPVIS